MEAFTYVCLILIILNRNPFSERVPIFVNLAFIFHSQFFQLGNVKLFFWKFARTLIVFISWVGIKKWFLAFVKFYQNRVQPQSLEFRESTCQPP